MHIPGRVLRSHWRIVIVPPATLLQPKPREGQWLAKVAPGAGLAGAGPHPESRRWRGCLRCPPGSGQLLPSRAHHGADLEKMGSEEVDADKTQLPGAGPTGLLGQLSWKLHGMLGLRLWRARGRLSLAFEASRPAPTPSLAPTPCEALPASPQDFLPQDLHLKNPPPRLRHHPNFLRSGLSLQLLQPWIWVFTPPSCTPADGASQPPAHRHPAEITPRSSKEHRFPGLSHCHPPPPRAGKGRKGGHQKGTLT